MPCLGSVNTPRFCCRRSVTTVTRLPACVRSMRSSSPPRASVLTAGVGPCSIRCVAPGQKGASMQRYRMYIGGQHVDPTSDTWFETHNPYTGEPWAEIARGNSDDVNLAVRAAHTAFTQGPWPELTASQRGLLIHRLGDLVAREAERLAEIEVRDNGKLLTEMRGQFNYIPQWYYYFGGLADKIEGSVPPIDKKGYFNFTRHEPLGVVAAITPWNSPLLLATWKIASRRGEFQGVIAATTPKGSCRVKLKYPFLSIGGTEPSILSARPPK